jgi:hypothetical protein
MKVGPPSPAGRGLWRGSLLLPLRGERRLAEREGFEPSVRFPVHVISNHAHSTTLSPLQKPAAGNKRDNKCHAPPAVNGKPAAGLRGRITVSCKRAAWSGTLRRQPANPPMRRVCPSIFDRAPRAAGQASAPRRTAARRCPLRCASTYTSNDDGWSRHFSGTGLGSFPKLPSVSRSAVAGLPACF